MGFFESAKAQFGPTEDVHDHAVPQTFFQGPSKEPSSEIRQTEEKAGLRESTTGPQPVPREAAGIAKVEATQAVLGKNGKYFVLLGMALMMTIFELDNSTVSNYQTFATSSFDQLSLIAALNTASIIISAVMKPPIAKVSDVIGRAETYVITITCYIISYILCASSKSINVFAGGIVFYAIGQTGTQILDTIIISDLTSTRMRGFAVGCAYFPFLITPWVSAFIAESVLDGIGWRWGIGMFAIMMPFCGSFLIFTLLYYQRKAKKANVVMNKKVNLYEFCSLIDLGGVILLSGGFAMLLLPLTLASTTPSKWSTPYIDVLVVLGVVFLILLIPYESFLAKHPVLPVRYFKNWSIVFSCALGAFDSLGFNGTHTYMYPWALVAHNYSVRNATFLVYTNGVMQCLVGIGVGWVMYRTRRYKWMMIAGAILRLIGYGIMLRLRGASNSTTELFIVQLIQGTGSGVVQTIIVVSTQIVVPHAELAQISSLSLLTSFLGSSIGSTIAGGIYTNTFKERLRHRLGAGASQATIDEVYNSVTGTLPAWGSVQRTAINLAYSDVMKYITISALVTSIPMLPLAYFLPNLLLNDSQNLVGEIDDHGKMVANDSQDTIDEST